MSDYLTMAGGAFQSPVSWLVLQKHDLNTLFREPRAPAPPLPPVHTYIYIYRYAYTPNNFVFRNRPDYLCAILKFRIFRMISQIKPLAH